MPVPTVTLTGEALVGYQSPLMRAVAIPIPTVTSQQVWLGRIRPHDLESRKAVAVKLSHYVDLAAANQLPDAVDWYTKAMVSINRMYLNDQEGDCVIAGKGHAFGVWTGNDTTTVALATDRLIHSTYQSWCGPGDNGCIITDVLDRCKSPGFPMDDRVHKIDGYADCDHTNKDLVKAAIYLFGCLSIGINLPQAWTSAAVWDTTNTQIVGGHDVTCMGYNAQGVQIASWGRIYTITWAAFQSKKWLDECWVLLAPDWYNGDNLAPNGVDVTNLKTAMQKIGGGVIPDVGPPVPPVPPVPPIPPIPPIPPGPHTYTIPVPTKTVSVFGVQVPGIVVPAYVLQGTFGDIAFELNSSDIRATPKADGGVQLTIPSWLVPVLKALCKTVPDVQVPGLWGTLVKAVLSGLCGLLATTPGGVTAVTIPPWLVYGLKLVCKIVPYLPEPARTLLTLLCGLVGSPPPAAKPCGCA